MENSETFVKNPDNSSNLSKRKPEIAKTNFDEGCEVGGKNDKKSMDELGASNVVSVPLREVESHDHGNENKEEKVANKPVETSATVVLEKLTSGIHAMVTRSQRQATRRKISRPSSVVDSRPPSVAYSHHSVVSKKSRGTRSMLSRSVKSHNSRASSKEILLQEKKILQARTAAHLKKAEIEKRHLELRLKGEKEDEEYRHRRQVMELNMRHELEQADIDACLDETNACLASVRDSDMISVRHRPQQSSKHVGSAMEVNTLELKKDSSAKFEVSAKINALPLHKNSANPFNDITNVGHISHSGGKRSLSCPPSARPVDVPSVQNPPVAMASYLPPIEPRMFEGDALEYSKFRTTLDCMMHGHCLSQSQKLQYLLKYTKGPPNIMATGHLHKHPDTCFDDAIKELDEKYNKESKTIAACLRAVLGPKLIENDMKGLELFSASLSSSVRTLQGIGCLNELNTQHTMLSLIERLPGSWKNGWDLENRIFKRQSPNVYDLVSYLGSMCDSIDGSQPKSVESVPVTKPSKPLIKATFATEVQKAHLRCMLCDESHYLNQCKQFKDMAFDQRKKFVLDKKLCFSCLNAGHMAYSCGRVNPCKRENCRGRHTTLLHPPVRTYDSRPGLTNKPNTGMKNVAEMSTQTDDGATNSVSMCATVQQRQMCKVNLPVVTVKVRAKLSDSYVITKAMLDNCSDESYMDKTLADKLNISGKLMEINVCTLNGARNQMHGWDISDECEVANFYDYEWYPLNSLMAIEKFPINTVNNVNKSEIDDIHEFKDVNIPVDDSEVQILIGQSNNKLLLLKGVVQSESGLVAINTPLGWTVSGAKLQPNNELVSYASVSDPSKICDMCTDVINSKGDERMTWSKDQQLFMGKLADSIKLTEDGHYEMSLPLRNSQTKLPSNRIVAEQRAMALKRKFENNQTFHQEYKNFMDDMFEKGYAERVVDENQTLNNVWYLSHHGVYHPRKETLRVVFDCAAKHKGLSLNDMLLPGPDLANNLVSVLTNFRRFRIGIQGDIKSMFLQVRVAKSDRDMIRFLWWPNGDLSQPLCCFRMTAFLFGTSASPSVVNYALLRTAKDNEGTFGIDITKAIKKSFYIDDYLDSKSDAESAINQIKDVRKLLKMGGFDITKWASNSREVLAVIPENQRAEGMQDLNLQTDALPAESSLGLIWDVETDTLAFKVKLKQKPLTRRGILSVINSVYDPLGLGQPAILPAKIILQTLCRKKCGWDDEIPVEAKERFLSWFHDLSLLSNFTIPRCFTPATFGSVVDYQIHHFSDASEKAYGAVSYLRSENGNGEVYVSIINGKSRVVPLKPLSIPRLELCAATIAAKNDSFLRRELDLAISNSFFWTDSTVVLRYLYNSHRAFQTFVANRVGQIVENSDVSKWFYVPSKQNPADLSSRGSTAMELMDDRMWKYGPGFLKNSREDWPVQPDFINSPNCADLEIKKSKECFVNQLVEMPEPDLVDRAVERHSDWFSLRKTVGWIMRYKKILQKRVKLKKLQKPKRDKIMPLSLEELDSAEMEIIKHEQFKYYKQERDLLLKGQTVSKSSLLYNFAPFLERGLIRVGGRISSASIQYEHKHQAIIPRQSPVVDRLILWTHEQCAHSGREYTLAKIREKYWIVRPQPKLRQILKDCVKCRKRQAKTVDQRMSDLPENRLVPDKPPFSYVALDCFGPFLVKRGRSVVKRYGIIFCCLTTKAIHLEILHSLDTNSFIMGLQRFICRRGQVLEIRSDNGGNFVSGEREIREAVDKWNQNQINQHLLQQNVKWMFQTPSASHHGGVFERQIRTVRKVLSAIVNGQVLSDECLLTLMCECEFVVNGRPITTVSNDPSDLQPLTPNSLLLMKQDTKLPLGVFDQRDAYSRRRWKQAQFLADCFWKRWRIEYLPRLQRRQKCVNGKPNLGTGDIVLVMDDNLPRNVWLLGRVVDVFPGKDDLIRSVRIKTKHSVLDRPVTKLVLLYSPNL